jgi:cytochrome c-type biogenesis protein CcmH
MKRAALAIMLGCLALASAAFAAPPEVPLPDPALEARAQNDIAVDMRAAIRDRVKAGDSDAQVRRYFADRYGEFVLLRPRVGIDTLALWGAPLVLLLIGAGALLVMSRKSRQPQPEANADEDNAAREALDRLKQR